MNELEKEKTVSENTVQENTVSEKTVPDLPDFLEETAPKPKVKLGKWRSFCEFCSKWLTGLVFLTILAQICYMFFKKEPFCPNDGCKVVETLLPLPLSPEIMNGVGLAYFGLLFLLFRSARKHPEGGIARALLPPFLLAGMAAEGVLSMFQYQNGTFCLYCCAILGTLLLISLFWGGRQMLAALFVFGGVCTASYFLVQPKTLIMPRSGIESGTFALKAGPKGSETRYFVFSESCRHCKSVLTALLRDESATLRLNPLAAPQRLELPGTAPQKDFAPEANLAFLRALGIDSVPVLLVQREDGGMTLHEGVNQISAYLGSVAGTAPEAEPVQEPDKAEAGDTPEASGKDAAGSGAAPEDSGEKSVQEEMQPEQSGESLTQPDKSAAEETAQSEQSTPEPAAEKEPEASKTETPVQPEKTEPEQAAETQEAPKADAPAKGTIPALVPSPDTKSPGAAPQEASKSSQNQNEPQPSAASGTKAQTGATKLTELKKVPPSAPLSQADTARQQSRTDSASNLSPSQNDSCRVDSSNCN